MLASARKAREMGEWMRGMCRAVGRSQGAVCKRSARDSSAAMFHLRPRCCVTLCVALWQSLVLSGLLQKQSRAFLGPGRCREASALYEVDEEAPRPTATTCSVFHRFAPTCGDSDLRLEAVWLLCRPFAISAPSILGI